MDIFCFDIIISATICLFVWLCAGFLNSGSARSQDSSVSTSLLPEGEVEVFSMAVN
jgi:hypothetical protein